MSEQGRAARRAAELMAQLCSSAATVQTKHELALLVATEHITLADFVRELSALTDERGASAYSWVQGSPLPGHAWHVARAEDVIRNGIATLDVRLYCAHCGSVVAFGGGALPPCTPGHAWHWTGAGWQRSDGQEGAG